MPCPKFVKAHILRNAKLEGWEERIAGRWSYRDLTADPSWFKGWISFDTVTWHPSEKILYCGLNSLDGDLLYAFDPKSQLFESLNTQGWADRFDVKIHRTLLLNPRDNCLYFATSSLHDIDQQHDAQGGKLVKFNPQTREFQVICVPAPHLYIQSIAADWERHLVYGFTYPVEAVSKTDLQAGLSEGLANIGSPGIFAQPHNAVVDGDGWLWGTYAETRSWDEAPGREPVRLFKYHPDKNNFVWSDHGLPRRGTVKQLLKDPPGHTGATSALAKTRHREDFGFCDSMAYDGHRYIYAGTVAGVLCRIDTRFDNVEKVANVMTTGRFPALAIKDNILYGGGGMNTHTQLIRWDTRTDRIEGYTELVDSKTGERPARIHDIAVDDEHQIFLGENDNHQRSSYLWALRLD
jgi:hypothetical protein